MQAQLFSVAHGTGAVENAGIPRLLALVRRYPLAATPWPLPRQIAHRLDPDSGEATDVPATEVLEALSRAKTVVFDKTGTLTWGTPAITEVRPEAGCTTDERWTVAASAEQYSSHVAGGIRYCGRARARERSVRRPSTS
ncbi:hypothetical protein [Cryobacterium sp.]|uniref:hypothetical protein n=1 Tax=Cryobacterium sp. TaxID=1926290 RepID=UPI003449CBCC